MSEDKNNVEDAKDTVKNISESAVVDPQGDYYNPDSNFNDGDTPTVVMIGGVPRAVKNGVILDNNRQEKKADELSKEELDYAKENREALQEKEGSVDEAELARREEENANSVIQGVKAITNPLPEEKLIDMEE